MKDIKGLILSITPSVILYGFINEGVTRTASFIVSGLMVLSVIIIYAIEKIARKMK